MRLKLTAFFGIVIFNAFSGLLATQILPGAERLFRIATAGADAAMIAMALLTLFKHRKFYGVKFLVLFLVASALTVLYNIDRMGLLAQLNGLRQPLFFFSALVVVYDIFQSDLRYTFERYVTLFLVLLAIAQIPTSVVQYLEYGAGDEVGGTYGLSGGSGFVTQLLFMIVFYLLVRHGSDPEGVRFSITRLVLFSVLLIPCILNETKISFVLLPALLLLMVEPRRFYRLIPLALVGVLLLYGLYYYYDQVVGKVDTLFQDDFVEKYLFYDRRQNIDVPRIQKIVLMFDIFSSDPFGAILGLGYGIFSGGFVLETTRLARSLTYLGGSRGLLLTMWAQGGVIGFAILTLCLFSYLKPALSVKPTVRRFALFVAFSLVAILFYNDAVLDRTFGAVLCYLIIWISSGGTEIVEEEADLDTPHGTPEGIPDAV